MTQSNQRLAALIGSRICHDLISPVGAIQNGVELLAMESRSGPEMSLIEDSVLNASARIRFLRIAFGLASEGQPVSRQEIDSVLADMSRAGRVRYEWSNGGDCSRQEVQAVLLAMMCLESGMPRGGTIVATRDGAGWAVTGPAEEDRPSPLLWDLLRGTEEDAAEVIPAHVQFVFLPAVLADRGKQAVVLRTEHGVTIRLPG